MFRYITFSFSALFTLSAFFLTSQEELADPNRKMLWVGTLLAVLLLYVGSMLPEKVIGKIAKLSTLAGSIILIPAYWGISWISYDYETNTGNIPLYGSVLISAIFAIYCLYGIFVQSERTLELDNQTLGIRTGVAAGVAALFTFGSMAVSNTNFGYLENLNAFMLILAITGLSVPPSSSKTSTQALLKSGIFVGLSIVSSLFFVLAGLQFLALSYLPLAAAKTVFNFQDLRNKKEIIQLNTEIDSVTFAEAE